MPESAMLANIIFPAPSYPYLLSFFLPVAVLAAMATETALFRVFQKKVTFGALLAVVLSANLFSWIAGMLLSGFLPSGLVELGEPGDTYVDRGPDYGLYVKLGFVFACVASILLELAFLVLLQKLLRLPLERLPLCVTVANLGSYTVLSLWVLLYRGI